MLAVLDHRGAERADVRRQAEDGLSHRLVTGEVAPCERLIDDHDTPGLRRVVGIEETAAAELHAQRFEIALRHAVVLSRRLIAARRRRHATYEERNPPSRRERQEIRGAGRFHPRLLSQRLDQCRVELLDLRPLAVRRSRQLNACGHDPGRAETGVLRGQPRHASIKQPRAGKQHDGERDLRRHQEPVRAPATGAARLTAAALLQNLLKVGA